MCYVFLNRTQKSLNEINQETGQKTKQYFRQLETDKIIFVCRSKRLKVYPHLYMQLLYTHTHTYAYENGAPQTGVLKYD